MPWSRESALLGVLDLDSPSRSRFDDVDAAGLEVLIRSLGHAFAP